MSLLYGILIGTLAQVIAFYQLQGRFKYEWLAQHQWFAVLLGIPISYLFMSSVHFMAQHFDGQLWPSRLIGFAIGTAIYTFMSILWFNEPVTMKTAICLVLSFIILIVQLFWK